MPPKSKIAGGNSPDKAAKGNLFRNLFLALVAMTAGISMVVQYKVYFQLMHFTDREGAFRAGTDKKLGKGGGEVPLMNDIQIAAQKQEQRMRILEIQQEGFIRREKEFEHREKQFKKTEKEYIELQAKFMAANSEKDETASKLEMHVRNLEEQQKRFDKMEAEYAKKDAEFAQQEAMIAKQEAEVAKQNVEYDRKQVEIARLQDTRNANTESAKILMEKLELLKRQEQEFAKKEIEVEEKQEQIYNKQQAVKRKEEAYEKIENEKKKETKTLQEKIAQLKQSQQQFSKKINQVQQKEDEIARKQAEFLKKEQEIRMIQATNLYSMKQHEIEKEKFEKQRKEFEAIEREFTEKEVDFNKQSEVFTHMQNYLMGLNGPQEQTTTSITGDTDSTTDTAVQSQSGGEEGSKGENAVTINEKAIAKKTVTNTTSGASNVIDCGCPHTCDARALRKGNAAFTCGFRIAKMMEKYGIDQESACRSASAKPDDPCEIECNPDQCKSLPAGGVKADLSNVDIHNPPFKRHENVVVATKVHWPKDIDILKQMFCLFSAAYNRHVNYDILVFTTIPWTQAQIDYLQEMVFPAKLTVAIDGLSTVEEHLETMTPDEITFLRNRCGVKEGEDITWFHYCKEEGYPIAANLAYAWQSEFRAYHIWKHEALKKYKYMIWMDSDSMCTKTWENDPMQAMLDNDLVLMFDNFPKGNANNPAIKDFQEKAYDGKSVCRVFLTEDGTFNSKYCNDEIREPKINQVHGFHHITNLDFYRQPENLKYLQEMTSQLRFSRQWDDQIGVTVPAAMLAPDRAWDMRLHGFNQGIHHNGDLDGKEKNTKHSYISFWNSGGKQNWEAGRAMCDGFIVNAG